MASVTVPSKINIAWNMAKKVRENAYAPYSNFKVGAVLVGRDGKLVPGCNVENASYGATVCAERTAMFRAVVDGEFELAHVVVVTDSKPPAPPCALCLQVLCEFAGPGALVWLGDLEGVREKIKLSELLPRHFGPKSLAKGLRRAKS